MDNLLRLRRGQLGRRKWLSSGEQQLILMDDGDLRFWAPCERLVGCSLSGTSASLAPHVYLTVRVLRTEPCGDCVVSCKKRKRGEYIFLANIKDLKFRPVGKLVNGVVENAK
jgi:hypothetical protein